MSRRSKFSDVGARRRIRQMLKSTEAVMRPAMKAEADLLRDEIKANAPRDTGALADLVTSYVAKNGLRAEAGLRGKKARSKGFYARFFEYGTKGGVVTVDDAQVLSGGDGTFGTRANIPAMPANPFIQPAWDKHKLGVRRRIGQAVKLAVRAKGNI